MGTGIFFPLCAIPFSIIISILFFTKKHIKTKETMLFGTLIVSNLIGLILEILCSYASDIYETNQLLSNIIYKSYLLYLIFWISTITYYVYSMIKNENKIEKNKIIYFIVYYIVNIIALGILDVELVSGTDVNARYTTGTSVSYVYILSAIAMIFITIYLLLNIKKLKNKRYIPIYLFILLGGISAVLQNSNPQLLLMTYVCYHDHFVAHELFLS